MEILHLKEQANQLPDLPGVYKFIDSKGNVIYVGKAKNIKKRVASYFLKNRQTSYKTIKMVSAIHSIEYIVVNSEKDALLLENSLIKTLQPKYNINLKDDKTYPYICVTNEKFPRVYATRRKIKNHGIYYGPYTKVGEMRELLDLIKNLYTIRTCKFNINETAIQQKKYKVCLEYHIKNCKGPCEGLQSEEDYNRDIAMVHQLLKGNINHVKTILTEKMNQAVSEMAYEMAHFYKENLQRLENFKLKSQVVSEKIEECEVYTILSDNKDVSYLNFIKINEGRVIHSETRKVKKQLDETDEEVLEFFINYMRLEKQSNTKNVYTNIPLQIDDLNVIVPERGEKKELVELSLRNIKEYKRLTSINDDKKEEIPLAILEIQKQMNLKKIPIRIECFDNSNFHGSAPVAAMVCFVNGKAVKKEYRKFHIKSVKGINDFDSIKEIVYRRYKRLLLENKPLPDLILIDGGKGQLNAAVEALKDIGIYGEVAIASIAKRLEEIYVPGDPYPLHFDKKSPALKLLQQIRDEVHRFALTFHRKIREDDFLKHPLHKIKGISNKSVKLLLEKYKTLEKIKEAPVTEIEELLGKKRTVKLLNFLNQGQ